MYIIIIIGVILVVIIIAPIMLQDLHITNLSRSLPIHHKCIMMLVMVDIV